MKIAITRKETRNRLACTRANGSCESADLGPTLPHHDLAHFVVERRLALQQGFFGRIAQGYSVAQLSDKEIIKSSPAESLVAEIAARALQAVCSGACAPDCFLDLVNTELDRWAIAPLRIELEVIEAMRAELDHLAASYRALAPGAALHLEFPEPAAPPGS